MRKTILMLTLLLSAMNVMAQAYGFKTEERCFDNGLKYVDCETKDFAKLNVFSPDIKLEMWDYYDEDKTPVVELFLYKYAKGEYKNSFAVADNIGQMIPMLSLK